MLKQVKEFLSKHKKIVFGIAVALIIIIIVLIIILTSKNKEKTRLETRLGELAKDFYEVKYYPGLCDNQGHKMDEETTKKFVAKNKDKGIEINLEALARLYGEEKDKILAEFKNNKTGEVCNNQNTKVIIYPQDPYGISDYNYKITLDCGF